MRLVLSVSPIARIPSVRIASKKHSKTSNLSGYTALRPRFHIFGNTRKGIKAPETNIRHTYPLQVIHPRNYSPTVVAPRQTQPPKHQIVNPCRLLSSASLAERIALTCSSNPVSPDTEKQLTFSTFTGFRLLTLLRFILTFRMGVLSREAISREQI